MNEYDPGRFFAAYAGSVGVMYRIGSGYMLLNDLWEIFVTFRSLPQL